MAREKVVDAEHLVAASDQTVAQVASQEAGASGHEDHFHEARS
jgi:hypothetical protein